jgi:hypothetical protein
MKKPGASRAFFCVRRVIVLRRCHRSAYHPATASAFYELHAFGQVDADPAPAVILAR